MRTAVSVGDNSLDEYVNFGVRRVGGCALNVAVYLQRAGISASYVGAVGEDAAGVWMIDGLRGQGVDVSHFHTVPGKTAVTRVKVNGGEREFLSEDLGVGENFPLSADDLTFIAQHSLAHFDILGFGAEHLAALRSQGVRLSYDFSSPGLYSERHLEMTLPQVEFAFFSGAHLAEDDSVQVFAREMRGRGPEIVVVTLGARGSLAFDGGNFYRQRAIETELVDTLGAGDAFIGTFLAGQLRGDSIPVSLDAATQVATRVCNHVGAWE